MTPAVPFSIVCLSSQDWDERLPTNRQQIMRRAAERGHAILFVETGGFVGKHVVRLVRGPERRAVARRLTSGERVAPGIVVRKALNIVPWGQRFARASRLNARVTAAVVRRATSALPKPVVLWTYDPCAAAAAGRTGEAFAVYDCVDDYPEQTGSDARRRTVVAGADAEAATTARLVFATTRPLYERQRARNARTYLAPNGADYERFSRALDRSITAEAVAALPAPVLGFAGNLTTAKVDFDLLLHVARARPEWTLLLIGPVDSSAKNSVDELAKVPNVVAVGPKPYASLHRYVAAFDVGLIPYTTNEYTRSCLPLKLFEYLAAGKPVVASGVPEVRGLEPDVLLRDDPAAFVAAVETVLGEVGAGDIERRRKLAARNTWETRTERLLGLVEAELAS